MKLNNKGFAITAVLYGLLILFVILVSSYLVVLAAKKERIDYLFNEIESEYSNNSSLGGYVKQLYKRAGKTEVKETFSVKVEDTKDPIILGLTSSPFKLNSILNLSLDLFQARRIWRRIE